MNELIVVEQLPVIKQQLEKIKEEVKEKLKIVDEVEKTIMTLSQEEQEEQKSKIKDIRTSFANDFRIYEERRTEIKKQILKPYEEMEVIYKDCVTEQYGEANTRLDKVISNIEDKQKKQLEDGATTYFNEYAISKNIDFLKFENVGLKIGVSDNPTKLKKQVTTFVDKVCDDLNLIETQEHKTEILVEYKQSLNVSQAITTVNSRVKAIEEAKQREVELQQIKQEEQKVIETVEQVISKQIEAPKKVEDVFTTTFTVTATRTMLKELKEFLVNGGYKYEQE